MILRIRLMKEKPFLRKRRRGSSCKTFAYGEEMEEGLWTILLPVMEAADGVEMDFLAGKRGKYFRLVK